MESEGEEWEFREAHPVVATKVYYVDLGTIEDIDRECFVPEPESVKKTGVARVLLELRYDEATAPRDDVDLRGVLCNLLRQALRALRSGAGDARA